MHSMTSLLALVFVACSHIARADVYNDWISFHPANVPRHSSVLVWSQSQRKAYNVFGTNGDLTLQPSVEVWIESEDTWASIGSQDNAPAYSYEGSTGVLSDDGLLLLYGGRHLPEQAEVETEVSNSLHLFDTVTLTWRQSGKAGPTPRYGHVAVMFGDCMYVHGGIDGSGNVLSSIDRYCISTNSWQTVGTDTSWQHSPGKMYMHVAVRHQQYMYVMTGLNENLVPTDALSKFDLVHERWVRIVEVDDPKPPAVRSGASAMLVPGEVPRILLYGGIKDKQFVTNIATLNLVTMKWDMIAPRGARQPSPLMARASVGGVLRCGDDPLCRSGTAALLLVGGVALDGSVLSKSLDALRIEDYLPCTAACGGMNFVTTCKTSGGAVACSCAPGYSSVKGYCFDADECALGTALCVNRSYCENTRGSYTCSCPPNQRLALSAALPRYLCERSTGCTILAADNYDSTATIDVGDCVVNNTGSFVVGNGTSIGRSVLREYMQSKDAVLVLTMSRAGQSSVHTQRASIARGSHLRLRLLSDFSRGSVDTFPILTYNTSVAELANWWDNDQVQVEHSLPCVVVAPAVSHTKGVVYVSLSYTNMDAGACEQPRSDTALTIGLVLGALAVVTAVVITCVVLRRRRRRPQHVRLSFLDPEPQYQD